MKKRLTGYTFSAAAKTVTHANFSDVTLAGIQLIVNVTDQIIIYNFADTAKGGTLATDTLTLEYDTTSMSDTDELMVLVEDGSSSLSVDTELPAAAALADGMANPTAPAVGAFNMGWDGGDWARVLALAADADDKSAADAGLLTNDRLYVYDGTAWDRLRGDSTNGMLVNLGGNNDVNATQLNGNTINLGAGAVGTGTQRTTLASDDPAVASLSVLDDWDESDRAKVNVIAGQAGITGGSGTVAANTPRVVLATDVALPAGTNAIGKLAANSGVDIGDVDVASVVPGTSATNLGKAEDGGHTTGDTGVFALAVRQDSPDTAVTNTTADYSQISVTSTGALRVAPMSEDFSALANGPQVKKYYTSAGAATDGIVWSPAAGKRWYVTDIFINVSAAATVTLEDDLSGGDSAVWKAELAANSGWSHSFNTPLFSGEDAADLLVTTSAGNVYITVTGYEI